MQNFEIVRKPITRVRLTITPTRITLKLPLDDTAEAEFAALSMRVASWLTPGLPCTLRGAFHNGSFFLFDDNRTIQAECRRGYLHLISHGGKHAAWVADRLACVKDFV